MGDGVADMDSDGNIEPSYTVGNPPDMVASRADPSKLDVADEAGPISHGEDFGSDPDGGRSATSTRAP